MISRLRLLLVPMVVTGALLVTAGPVLADSCDHKHAYAVYENTTNPLVIEFDVTACTTPYGDVAYNTTPGRVIWWTGKSSAAVASRSATYANYDRYGHADSSWRRFWFSCTVTGSPFTGTVRVHPRAFFHSGMWREMDDGGNSNLYLTGYSLQTN